VTNLWIPSSVDIDSRLVKRFTLSEQSLVPNPYWLQRVILPVTNIDGLLIEPDIKSGTIDISGAGALYVPAATVPDGYRWYLKALYRYTTTAATRVGIKIGSSTMSLTAGATAAAAVLLGTTIILDEGDSFGMYETGNGADSARTIEGYVEVEKAF